MHWGLVVFILYYGQVTTINQQFSTQQDCQLRLIQVLNEYDHNVISEGCTAIQ